MFEYTQSSDIIETNTMNPDQAAPKKQSDLGSYWLQIRQTKLFSI